MTGHLQLLFGRNLLNLEERCQRFSNTEFQTILSQPCIDLLTTKQDILIFFYGTILTISILIFSTTTKIKFGFWISLNKNEACMVPLRRLIYGLISWMDNQIMPSGNLQCRWVWHWISLGCSVSESIYNFSLYFSVKPTYSVYVYNIKLTIFYNWHLKLKDWKETSN